MYTVSRVPKSCVEVASMRQLDGLLAGATPVVFLLYMPWCPPCIKFHPEFSAAQLPIQSAAVNQESFAHPRMSPQSYPELWLWDGKELRRLEVASRDAEGVRLALSQAGVE